MLQQVLPRTTKAALVLYNDESDPPPVSILKPPKPRHQPMGETAEEYEHRVAYSDDAFDGEDATVSWEW